MAVHERAAATMSERVVWDLQAFFVTSLGESVLDTRNHESSPRRTDMDSRNISHYELIFAFFAAGSGYPRGSLASSLFPGARHKQARLHAPRCANPRREGRSTRRVAQACGQDKCPAGL